MLNIEYKELLYIASKNFIKGGVLISIPLTILEMLPKEKKYVAFYAFAGACFIYLNLIEFHYLGNIYPESMNSFLIHTIIGSSLFISLTLLQIFFLYIKISLNINILITLILHTIFVIIYFNLIKTNKLSNI